METAPLGFFFYISGKITESITCTIPLVASISAAVTVASLIMGLSHQPASLLFFVPGLFLLPFHSQDPEALIFPGTT